MSDQVELLEMKAETEALSKSPAGKIIVVDDEPELKNILVEVLSAQGFEVTGCGSGHQALEELRQRDFDLLLTDLMMPEMDGITLLEAALKIDPQLIGIIMTGRGTIQTAVDAMKVGAFDYVLKPFRLQTVMPALTRAISTRRLRMENLQLRETVAIYSLCQTIAFTLDPQTVISKLADAVLQQTDADEVSVLLPTSEGSDELYVAAVRGGHRERLLGERVPLEESISGWAAREREPLMLEGEINDDRFRSLWPHPEIRSTISVPMQVGNKLVGTININAGSRLRPITLGQMKALTILASTAAAALESASLYLEVQKAEENYRSIFENAVDGIFRATPDATRFISVNPFMAQMFGYNSPEEMVEAVVDMTEQLGLDPARRDEALSLLKKHGVVENFETLVRRKDGTEIWTSENIRAIRNADGELEYLDGIVQDITERKRAEQALRASEAEMRAVFASMTDVIIEFDAQGRHVKIAPTKTLHLYKPASERIGKTIHEIFPKEKADFFLAQIRQALAKGRTHRVEYSLPINGREYWYDASISPMTENSVIWVARDITERKQAEEERARLTIEIEKQRERLDSLVSSVPGVVWEAWGQPDAATQRIDFVSDYVEKMLGYSVEEWLATPNFWLTIVHPADKEEAAREAATSFAAVKDSTVEFRWIARDGHAVWVESNYVVIKDDEGQPIGLRGVTTDISKRKQAEAELNFQKSLLESQTEASIDGILAVSDDREILSFNQRFVDLWGIPEIVGSRSDEKALQSVLDKLETPGEFLEWVEYLYRHPQESSRDEIQLNDGRTFDRYSAPIKSPYDEYYGRVWFFRDITERKRAVQVLQETARSKAESLALLDTILSTAPIGFAFHNRDLCYERINESLAAINGLSVQQHLGKTLRQVLPEMSEILEPLLQRVIDTGEPITDLEISGETPADLLHQHYWLVSFYPVRMQEGELLGVGVLVSEITERKRAEEALRRSESQLAEAQRVAHIGSWNWNLQKNGLTWSDEHYRIFGVQPGDISVNYDEVVFDFIHPEDRDLVRNVVKKSIETMESFNFYYRIVRRDGEERIIQSSGSIETDEQGQPIRMFGTAQDVTEHRRIEQELRQSEERYRDLVENAHDIIYSHDLKGNYTSINKAGEQITGYSLAETLNLNIADTVAPEYLDKAKEMLAKKLAGEKVTAYEMQILAKNGRRVTVEVNTKLMLHNGVPVGIQGIARDVTERKLLEEQLRQSQKLEAIGQLAGGVAHDFNNLLTVIGGYSSILLGKLPQDSPHRSSIEEIKKAGDRASGLTRQLLAFSRKQILQPKVLDLNIVVTDLEKMVRRLIGEDIDLLTVTSPVLGKVKADPGQIEQVLLNLIVNARDAMPKGGKVTIETSNVVLSEEYAQRHAALPGAYVMLAVSDTGCGMDAEIQPRVFEPFFTTKGSVKGTGLGLATVYGIVKQSGGNIWVYSEPGQGSTFKIYLPRVDEPMEGEEVISKSILHGTEMVLLVEDEDQVRTILKHILEGQGYHVLAAANGEEALSISQNLERDIKLMITDVVMPVMSGRELAERVLVLRPSLPVLFMSGYTDDAIVRHGLLDEKLNFIQKPFDSTTVARKVREVLDSHR